MKGSHGGQKPFCAAGGRGRPGPLLPSLLIGVSFGKEDTTDMKHLRIFALALAAALLLAGAGLGEAAFGPGLIRTAAGRGCEQAAALAEKYGVALTDDRPLYVPARPQPMNAFMVTHPDCQVGIDGDGMYLVREKGLIPEITGYLERWMGDIEAASGGAIRFVADPDDADVLIVAKQSYDFYGEYAGSGLTAQGYACTVGLTAVQLTHPENRYGVTETRRPEDTVSLRSDAPFWKTPPELSGTDKLDMLVENILGWYGLGARNGSKGDGVRALQQALIDRGFLNDRADGQFGPKSEAALKLLQERCGLEQSGAADVQTLVAAYYGG